MNERSVKWKLLFEPRIQKKLQIAGELNFHSEANEIFSKIFAVLNFRFLSFKRKEQASIL